MPPAKSILFSGSLFSHSAKLILVALLSTLNMSFSTNAQSEAGKWLKSPLLPETTFQYFPTIIPPHLAIATSPNQPTALDFDRADENLPNLNTLATLGRVLFYDRNLSKNGLVSCASCHDQRTGFDDHSQFSIGFKGKITHRNSMGLTYARFNQNNKYFWDERANSLSDTVLRPYFNSTEMGLLEGDLLELVANNSYYDALLIAAFGSKKIAQPELAAALSTFIFALAPFSSPYDLARADASGVKQYFQAFTKEQNRGKFLFFSTFDQGGGECIFCHQTEVFISTGTAFNIGLDKNNSEDKGVGGENNKPNDEGKFRVSSLRNIAKRAPYMHDGRFSTLEEVIDHYSSAIKPNPNLAAQLKNTDGSPRTPNFSDEDKAALVAFLNTLSDTSLQNEAKFSNPFRKPTSN